MAANAAAMYNGARNPFGLDEILEHISDSDIVLDAGCGTGQHAQRISSRAASVVGIDTDATRLDIARQTSADTGTQNVTFQVASMLQLPFEDCSFNVVINCQVHHHLAGNNVTDIRALRGACQTAIGECMRVMRTGGQLILITTSWEQRFHAYCHFRLFPSSAWDRLKAVWTLTDGEWFDDVMRKNGLRQIQSYSPKESHWRTSNGEQQVTRCLEESWRSTDVAFELLTEAELRDFERSVRVCIDNGCSGKLAQEAKNGRETMGEATVRVYVKEEVPVS